jgi:CMP-N-acetylneuraminic acid synthetase
VKVLGVIPARLASTRLPRKVLREIGGIPLVVHVYRAARRSPRLDDLLVATDSDEVAAACRAHGIPAVMTAESHASGTDRLWEVSQGRQADVYVNIQGDEPLVSPGHIEGLVSPFLSDPDVQVTTLKIRVVRARRMLRELLEDGTPRRCEVRQDGGDRGQADTVQMPYPKPLKLPFVISLRMDGKIELQAPSGLIGEIGQFGVS